LRPFILKHRNLNLIDEIKIQCSYLFMKDCAYPLMWSHIQLKGEPPIKTEPLPDYYQTGYKYHYSNFEREESWYDDSNFFGNPFQDDFKDHRQDLEEDENYSVLGLKRSASDEDIKQAFREKALLCHPDKGGDPEDFRKVREAYENLI
jgi:hypothetical protein